MESEEEVKKTKKDYIKIPYWLANKAKNEDVSLGGLLVYCWIYDHNDYSLKKYNKIFGCTTYEEYHQLIKNDIGINDVKRVINEKLLKKEWLSKSKAGQFKGRKNVGYLCLLDSRQRQESHIGQQELHLSDELEENATLIESSLPTTTPAASPTEPTSATPELKIDHIGQFSGYYYYYRDGESVIIPESAYIQARDEKIPNSYIFDFEADRWCSPEDETQRPNEF